MFYFLVGIFYVVAGSVRQWFPVITFGIFFFLFPIFLLETPLGGDFNSLISRASENYESSNFLFVFNFLRDVSILLGINISSLYSLVIYIASLLLVLQSRRNLYLIAGPIFFVFYASGFQRQALSAIFILIAINAFSHKHFFWFSLISILAYLTHPTAVVFLVLYLLSMIGSFRRVFPLLLVSPLLFEYVVKLLPFLEHYYVHYYLSGSSNHIWILFLMLSLPYFLFVRSIESRGERAFLYSLLTLSLSFLFFDASNMAFRILFFLYIALHLLVSNLIQYRPAFIFWELSLFSSWFLLSESSIMWRIGT